MEEEENGNMKEQKEEREFIHGCFLLTWEQRGGGGPSRSRPAVPHCAQVRGLKSSQRFIYKR